MGDMGGKMGFSGKLEAVHLRDGKPVRHWPLSGLLAKIRATFDRWRRR